MSEVKKTRNRKPKELDVDQVVNAAMRLTLEERIRAVKSLKESILSEIDEQAKIAEAAKDL